MKNNISKTNFVCMMAALLLSGNPFTVTAQTMLPVTVKQVPDQQRLDILIGGKPFTSFLYPDTLEKPVLYPVHTASGTIVTRGFPLAPRPNDPTDHPHHIGIWFNFENLNGLDFWNNSFAIPAEKKQSYGWIKTDRILETKEGTTGSITYHANWTNQKNETLMEETTKLAFSGNQHQRFIERETVFTATTGDVLFTDAKDGMLAIRLAPELQIPAKQEEKSFKDDKGNITVVKAGIDSVATGNYITSEGKMGDDVWSTRGRWCKIYGKMGRDSVAVIIIDHPQNTNYPTFWHARGYGLFAANPLGEKIFTNGASAKNLAIKKGASITFRYRVIVDQGNNTLTSKQIDVIADAFAKTKKQ